VSCAASGCVFVNLHYPKAKLLQDRDLLEALKSLAKLRDMSKKRRR